MNKLIKILVVDDHEVFRRGLVELLNEEPDLKLVGEADSGPKAVERCAQLQPDVILMDIHMPGGDGIEALKEVKELTQARVLMLTVSEKDKDLMEALNAGADGYLLKNTKPDQLCAAIREVFTGGGALSPEITPRIITMATRNWGEGEDVILSPRESEVLSLLAKGSTTAQIANALTISENTVKTHIRRILKKLNASNRTEAVAKAAALGLLYQGR